MNAKPPLIVLKFGGSAFAPQALRPFAERVQSITAKGERVIVVHGGGKEINNLLDRLGKKSTFRDGLRVTDEETLDVVEMVLSGRVNKALVRALHAAYVPSVGLSGTDGGLLAAEPLVVERETAPGQLERINYGLVGQVASVRPAVLAVLLEAGFVPVVSPVALSGDGGALNVNADTSAAQIAGAMKADSFWLLTDVPGVMVPSPQGPRVVTELTVGAATSLKQRGIVTGGMIPKVDACLDALNHGASSARIVSLNDFVAHENPSGTRIAGA